MNELNSLFKSRKFAESEIFANALLERYPDSGLVWELLGLSLQMQGKNALHAFQKTAELMPEDAGAQYNLGSLQKLYRLLGDAAESYRRAIRLKPDFAEAYSNLGNVLKEIGRLDEAIENYQQALTLKPDAAEIHNNLAGILMDKCRFGEAVQGFRRALELKPGYADAYSNMLFCLFHYEADGKILFDESRRFAQWYETPLRPGWPHHGNERDPGRKLKIGFVSADFYNHSVAHFFELVAEHLARNPQLSLHAYYNNTIEDEVTQRLKSWLPHWTRVVGMPDEVLAKKIHEDGIDILYDLSGHTAKNRLLVFARKPAPIQVSWIGSPGTTGLSAMDYYQSDRFLFPDDRFDGQYTEKVVRLPASSAFMPNPEAPPVSTLPALANGYVTFGSFNRLSKVSREVVALWSQLLRALPDSRLLLGGMPRDDQYRTLIQWFTEENISTERLEFHQRSDMKQYLALHQQVDICLDTFPYNGGTTTFHALWMGVPTLTLSGHTLAGWAGSSILGHVGLQKEFAASDADEFVRLGRYWQDHFSELNAIRFSLRDRFAHSARGRPDVVAESMARAMRVMWQRWCSGLEPVSFEISWDAGSGLLQEVLDR